MTELALKASTASQSTRAPRIAPSRPVFSATATEASSNTLVMSSKSAAVKDKSSKISTSDAKSADTSGSSNSITLSSPELGVPDWTAKNPSGLMSDHVRFARTVDWAATPLGDMTNWAPEFREVANLLMKNPHPAALFWGEELTMLYNEAYAKEVAGNKHPELMGTGTGPQSSIT